MMEDRRIRIEELGGILKRIGNYNPSTFSGSFDARLIFQKTIYLLQCFGIYLGYYFSWYIHGPYSTTLARDGFDLIDKYDKAPIVKFVEKRDKLRFNDFLIFLGQRKNDADWLEILASIHILKRLYPTENKEKIIDRVMDKDPHFKKEICKQAFDYLYKYKLI